MVQYKDNPDLKELAVVITFNGETEYRKNCKYINEKYYIINKTCFEFEGKWRRIDDKDVVYDWEKNTYVLRSRTPNLLYGLIRNKEDQLELGYFSSNTYRNVMCNSGVYGNIPALSEETLGSDWFEDMKYHQWHKTSEWTTLDVIKKKKIQNYENPANRGYNIEDNQQDFEFKIQSYENYKSYIGPKIRQLAKYVGDITFGCEFELHLGYLPHHLQARYGVVPCRDGSLNGGIELVTVPMSGAKGLQTLVNLADDLKKRGEINLDCSFHIHFGNIGTDKLSVISLYRLCRKLQEELFTMFPYYKTDPSGIKQKNYTKKLQKLNIGALRDTSKDAYETYLLDSWNKLFTFYAEKQITLENFDKKSRQHPITNKWSRPSRYFYFNFMNMFFTHRHTLEARLSGATTNKDKVINWLLICIAIIRYSKKYAKDIITTDKTVSLKEVLEIYPTLYPNDPKANFLSKYLHNYFLERQARCKNDWSVGDYKSMWDIDEDKQFTYSYLGENLLE